MEDKEKLHFKIGLSGASLTRYPEFQIKVNDVEHVHETLSSTLTEYFEFDVELSEGEHCLNICFLNKTSTDTRTDDSGNIIEDMLLHIESIEIDEIDIGTLKWTASSYFPDYPESYLDETQKQIKELKGFVDLGWNGTWKLPFASPFYIWLLENL